jgi:hypothetical protein
MKYSDDQIGEFLRKEAGEERLAFSIKGLVFLWEAAKSRALPLLVDRDELNDLLLDYLHRHGRDFATLEDAQNLYGVSKDM